MNSSLAAAAVVPLGRPLIRRHCPLRRRCRSNRSFPAVWAPGRARCRAWTRILLLRTTAACLPPKTVSVSVRVKRARSHRGQFCNPAGGRHTPAAAACGKSIRAVELRLKPKIVYIYIHYIMCCVLVLTAELWPRTPPKPAHTLYPYYYVGARFLKCLRGLNSLLFEPVSTDGPYGIF